MPRVFPSWILTAVRLYEHIGESDRCPLSSDPALLPGL